MPTEASSNSAFISQPKPAPKPKAKPKPKPKPTAPEREFTEEECEKENKKTEEQILEYLLAVSGKMAHPLHPSKEGVHGGANYCAECIDPHTYGDKTVY